MRIRGDILSACTRVLKHALSKFISNDDDNKAHASNYCHFHVCMLHLKALLNKLGQSVGLLPVPNKSNGNLSRTVVIR